MRRLTLPLTILALALAPGVASAQTLRGETFSGETTSLSGVSCDEAGTSSFGFHSVGLASGPLDGTYSETGTVQVGPQAPDPVAFGGAIPVGQVLDVRAQFEVRSATGEVLVVGSKRLIEPLPVATGAVGACTQPPGFPDYITAVVSGNLCYDAAFTAGGTERGTARLMLQSAGSDFVFFREDFPVSLGATCPPLLPTSKQECKKGGAFEDSDQFANQGDCVSFVATRGKNEPGRNEKK